MIPETLTGLTRRSLVRTPARAALAALTALALWGAGLPAFAAPPAGTPIGNQASATYLDASSTPRTVTSNLVTTIVQQVASFTLTADGVRTASPGGQASFPHVLTNTGNGTDAFPLSLANLGADDFDLTGLAIYEDADGNGVADNFVPILTTGPLASGAAYRFVVVGNVPGVQIGGQFSLARVTAVSTFDGAQTAFNTDRVNVTGNAVITTTKSISQSSGASPSGPYTYTLTYQNTGNSTATALVLTDAIPAGMTYVPSSGRWSVTGASVLTDASNADAQGTAPNTIVYDFGATTGNTVTATIARVAPGASGTLTFQIGVNAGLGPQTINNQANFAYNDGAANVGPFVTNVAPFTINQTASVTFTGQTIASATQGSLVSFSNTLTNTGNGTDVFDIVYNASTFPAGTLLTLYQSNGITPLNDSNGNGIPDSGPLAAGASTTIVLHAQLPSAATGGPFSVNKVATSETDPLATATATDVLTAIAANTVDLTNNAPLPGAPGAGPGPEAVFVVRNATNPGLTTRFTLYVNNTSAVADNFDLAASTNPTFATLTLPAGWTVTFRNAANSVITNTGNIAAGGNFLAYADVDVPAGFSAGDVDLYFRSLSPASTASDRIHDQVRVNPVRTLSLVPNNTAQVIPGGFAVYTHVLTNTGNVTEGDGAGSFVALSHVNDQAGWSSALYWDTNGTGVFDAGDLAITDLSLIGGLAPGASVRLFVRVSSPAGAPLGQLNTTTVTATTSNLAYVSAVPAPAVATDGTTVINGQLTISKAQALDALCDGSPDGPYGVLNITTGAVPGACLRYEITVTNIGTTSVTNVVVNDATPANTVYSDAVPASTTVGTIVNPLNGAAGTIVATVGTLAPGQSAVITFGVRINP